MLYWKAYPRHSINFDIKLFNTVLDIFFRKQLLNGPHVRAFEERFCGYIGVKHATAIASGRSGLYLILKSLNFDKEDEIIMPAYTYSALPIPPLACGLKPVFVDVCRDSYNINPELIEGSINRKTKAIFLTHMSGQPCDMDPILKIAERNNLVIIEDCAHACGAKYKGKRVGSFGRAAIFSFQVGKSLPCFGGGMIATNDDFLTAKIRESINQFPYPKTTKILKAIFSTFSFCLATKKEVFPYLTYPLLLLSDLFGIDTIDRQIEEKTDLSKSIDSLVNQNKFTNIQAAVGIILLSQLDTQNSRARENARLLTSKLSNIKSISVPYVLPGSEPTNLYYCIGVQNTSSFRKKLLRRGIDTKRDNMSACHKLDIFKDRKTRCPVAEELPKRTIEIPNSAHFNKEDILFIAEQIRKVAAEINS